LYFGKKEQNKELFKELSWKKELFREKKELFHEKRNKRRNKKRNSPKTHLERAQQREAPVRKRSGFDTH
jgi:hypothetical protein